MEQAGLASGLLSQAQIDAAWHALTESLRLGQRSLVDLSDELLTEKLIEQGALNRWQAEQLRRGHTKFTLGPYRILDAIGHGGMGYVFKGEHSLLGRVEAIKVLPRSQMSPASLAAFCREIRAQAQLDHPNHVRLSFADAAGDTYYLVTEYVPGADLRRLIRHHGPLTAVQAAAIVSQAADALAYAHQRGLIHRDVKPGNLLVTPEGLTKLTDLGLAYFSSEATASNGNSNDKGGESEKKTRHIVGTPDFVAPESIRNPGEVRPASDVYSLGCTLYYAITGKVPFPGGKTVDKLRRHLDEEPMAPSRINSQADEALAGVVRQMMHKSPKQRVPSAAEVVALLQPWTKRIDEATWRQIGQFAQAPGEPTYVAEENSPHPGAEEPDTPDRQLDASLPTPRTPLPAPAYRKVDDGFPASESDRRGSPLATAPSAGISAQTFVLVAVVSVLAILAAAAISWWG